MIAVYLLGIFLSCARPVNYTSTTVLPSSLGNNLHKYSWHSVFTYLSTKTFPQPFSPFPIDIQHLSHEGPSTSSRYPPLFPCQPIHLSLPAHHHRVLVAHGSRALGCSICLDSGQQNKTPKPWESTDHGKQAHISCTSWSLSITFSF